MQLFRYRCAKGKDAQLSTPGGKRFVPTRGESDVGYIASVCEIQILCPSSGVRPHEHPWGVDGLLQARGILDLLGFDLVHPCVWHPCTSCRTSCTAGIDYVLPV